MKKKYYLFVISAILLSSCYKNESFEVAQTNYLNSVIELDTAFCTIPITGDELSFYKTFAVTPEGIYYGLNTKSNVIDVFSLVESKHLRKIKLPTHAGGKSMEVTSLFVHNSDSIFILTPRNILILNEEKIVGNLEINSSADYFKNRYLSDIDGGANFKYNVMDKHVYLTSYDPTFSTIDKKRYLKSFIVKFKMDSLRGIVDLPTPFSARYQDGYFGYLSYPQFNLTVGGNNVIYNFPIEPNIYLLDIKTGVKKTYGAKPTLDEMKDNFLVPTLENKTSQNEDKKFMHYVLNSIYYPVMATLDKKYYIRPFNSPKEVDTLMRYSSINDKKRYITLLDSNFSVIGDVDLNDQSYYLPGQFVTNQGYFLPCVSPTGTMRFKRFNFTH